MNNIMMSSIKDSKAEVSIESIKQTVKKFKNQGFQSLTHHQLALALSTVGFSEVCKEFGATWSINCQKEALKILENSDYDLGWYGKTNNLRFASLLTLCTRGDIEKVKQLLSTVTGDSKKQLYSTVDNLKRSALHIAVKEGYDVLAQYLINEGFPLNGRDRELKTPLHYCKNELICQVLVNKKAKIIVKDNKMCTPVHYAASGADYRTLQILLKGANIINQKDATGKTAIFYSIYNSSEQQINIIRILLQNGAKLNQQDIYGKTPLHYASQMGKSRCIPILLRKGASIDVRNKNGKTPLDLAQGQDKIKKIIIAYCNNKGAVFQEEQTSKRKQIKDILQDNYQSKVNVSTIGKEKQSKISKSKEGNKTNGKEGGQTQIFTKQVNQVSTWVRQKFFVLMKKLQESGVKALWHLKRPYIYTGSWAEDVESLEDLYETFLNVNGPQAAMRAFNILCPYQKALPTVINRTDKAFQSFFGESWFSTDPIQKLQNLHSSNKIRTELEIKIKQIEDLKIQLLRYKSQIQNQQSKIMNLNQEIKYYKKIQEDLRKQKNKNTQQYTEMLKLMAQNQQLKTQVNSLMNTQEKTKIISNLVDQLKTKNTDLIKQIDNLKVVEAAARRKCGQIFLKSLTLSQKSQQFKVPTQNLYDDDAIINLYNLLKNNPPNLQKRFQKADKRGSNKLTIDEFTQMLQNLSMLPQDVMSMHRITGFAYGRKTLSLEQFKTILENRHKNRPMWEKNLIRKIKTIILQTKMSIQKFFKVMDKDGNGTIEASQLRKGLQNYNIFMNQNDWSNLFNLLDSDNSGQIDLNQLKTLLDQERTGKLDELQDVKEIQKQGKDHEEEQSKQQVKQHQQQNYQDQFNQQVEEQNKDNVELGENEEQNQDNNQQQNEEQNKQQNEQQNKQQNEQQQNYQNEWKQNEQPQNLQQQKYDQQFNEPYQQQDSDVPQNVTLLNGTLKIQVPTIKFQNMEGSQNKVYVKFFINQDIDSDDAIKLADLTKPKLQIVSEIKFIQYKVLNIQQLSLNVSIWTSRDMVQQNYLGQININLQIAIDKPGQWAINQKSKLSAELFQKDVKGTIGLQVKWSPIQIS